MLPHGYFDGRDQARCAKLRTRAPNQDFHLVGSVGLRSVHPIRRENPLQQNADGIAWKTGYGTSSQLQVVVRLVTGHQGRGLQVLQVDLTQDSLSATRWWFLCQNPGAHRRDSQVTVLDQNPLWEIRPNLHHRWKWCLQNSSNQELTQNFGSREIHQFESEL